MLATDDPRFGLGEGLDLHQVCVCVTARVLAAATREGHGYKSFDRASIASMTVAPARRAAVTGAGAMAPARRGKPLAARHQERAPLPSPI